MWSLDCGLVLRHLVVLVVVLSFARAHGSAHRSRHHKVKTLDGEEALHHSEFVHDKEHIKEHYDGQVKFEDDNMTDAEMEWHFFKQHDFDNNTKLDGLEILQALNHAFADHDDDELGDDVKDLSAQEYLQRKEEKQNETMTAIIESIDKALAEEDLNKDGYISYVEYQIMRKMDEIRRKNEEKKEEGFTDEKEKTGMYSSNPPVEN